MDLLPLIPTGASRVHGNSVLTWDSSGSGDSGPHLALLTMVLNWAKMGPGDCVPHLDLPWTS